jgi:hypothetical protein
VVRAHPTVPSVPDLAISADILILFANGAMPRPWQIAESL